MARARSALLGTAMATGHGRCWEASAGWRVEVPRARLNTADGKTTEWKSKALRAYQRRTLVADALIAGSYLAGTNTRRVRRALAALFGGAVGKDTVSRVWRKVKTDWEAWNARSLVEEPIVRLILIDALGVATTQLVVLLAWQRGPRFMRVLPTLVEDLFDVVGRPYDGVDHVVLDDVHETMLDPAKSDHPLAALGVVAQTPCDVAANFNLHSRLAEINIAAVAQFKAHHVLQQSTNGSSAIEQGDDRRRRAEFSAGQNRDLELSPSDALTKRSRRLSACQTILDAIGNLLADSRQVEEFLFAEDICGFFGNLPIHRRLVPKIIIPIHAWHCVQDLSRWLRATECTVSPWASEPLRDLTSSPRSLIVFALQGGATQTPA